jgi:hypothetical protein
MPLQGLVELASRRVATNQRPMEGLLLLRQLEKSSPEASLYEPVLCLILQGKKKSRSASKRCRSARGSACS